MAVIHPKAYSERPDDKELPCKDKLVFDSKRQADASANVVHYRYGNAVHSYKCRYCHLWHLASGRQD